MRVCSLRYRACNTHAPYCHLWPLRFYHIFLHYLMNGTIFEGERSYWTQNVFYDFLYKFRLKYFSYQTKIRRVLVLIYLLTTIGLSPGGSSTVHIYTQTVHRTTQNKQYIEQHNNLGECGPCPVLGSYTLAFALHLRKKHGKTSVRVAASKNT